MVIDRWEIGEFGTPMDLMSDGDYVSYSDYAKLEHELAMCRRYNEQHGQNLAAIAEENQRLRDCMERAHDEVMDDPREAIRLLNEGLEGYEPR